ncbi:MAG: carbonic anhydrase [Actinomycetota bacterium]|nr:carbonic anhydrase [Actinomycetota bacterium]
MDDLQLPALLRDNEAYQHSGFHAALRTPRPSGRLVILTCMDARLDLFRALGLEVGQAHVLRNAGGRASADAVRSLIISTHLLGTREIGVIHHTNCGLEGVTDAEVAERTGVTGVDFLAFASVEDSVREDVEIVRTCGHFEDEVVVWGAIYDVDRGAIELIVEPEAVTAKVSPTPRP